MSQGVVATVAQKNQSQVGVRDTLCQGYEEPLVFPPGHLETWQRGYRVEKHSERHPGLSSLMWNVQCFLGFSGPEANV